ncbi:MAG: threonine dehydratase [bacterium]|jgi:threonine dehydratase
MTNPLDHTISIQDIQAARTRIQNNILLSPCNYSHKISLLTECDVFLKLENMQMTGAYKQRGALNKILQLTEEEKQAGVITSSAGNHAQGVAYAAQCNNIKATIVMAETTPFSKVQETAKFGANIILHGNSYDEAYQKARQIQKEQGLTFIHAFDDLDVIAGQGTIGLELLEQNPFLEVILVPIGGGGLISGLATAIKSVNPKIKIIGVETDVMPAMQKSIQNKKITAIPAKTTIAEGIAVAQVGSNTYPIVQKYVDDIITVSEEEIANAIMVLLDKEKILVEGAGAVGVAALLNQKVANIEGKKVGVIITGGNIDMTMLARVIERGLAKEDRLANFRVLVPDRPGILAELSNIIANQKANIMQISHHRHFTQNDLGEAEVEFTLETKGHQHVQEIRKSLVASGFIVHQQK